MKSIFAVTILIFSFQVYAGKHTTNYFYLDLPEKFVSETDKTSSLVAFEKDFEITLKPPVLMVDFSPTSQIDQFVRRLNSELSAYDESLEKEQCGSDCVSYYYEGTRKDPEMGEFFIFIRVVQTSKLTYVITYFDNSALELGRKFSNEINRQVQKNGI